jgi:acetoin utilization deacetylase AcuC-like enzyme
MEEETEIRGAQQRGLAEDNGFSERNAIGSGLEKNAIVAIKKGIVYSKKYGVDIGAHVFPVRKYGILRERLIGEGLVRDDFFLSPEAADDSDLLLVHERDYIDRLKKGKLTPAEIMTLELPYSRELVEASSYCVGGTILACKSALLQHSGIHIGGGFHHAFPDHGEGFCVFNDVAIGVRRLIKDGDIKKAVIIDCDLHQGNGTAFIFRNDTGVFTFSMHQQNNYPFHKPKSDMDIGLRDRTQDKEYLSALRENIPKILSDFKPDFLMYVAGADAYKDDQIGNLALSMEGLKKRDEFVYEMANNYDLPIATVLAGGYAEKTEDTVSIHYNTVKAALDAIR